MQRTGSSVSNWGWSPCPWRAASQPLVHWEVPGGYSSSKFFKNPVNRDKTGLHVLFWEGVRETPPCSSGAGGSPPDAPPHHSPAQTLSPPRDAAALPLCATKSPTPLSSSCFPPSIHVAAPLRPDPGSCPTTSGPSLGQASPLQCPSLARASCPLSCVPSTAPGPQPALAT